jgi:hypothetical protein
MPDNEMMTGPELVAALGDDARTLKRMAERWADPERARLKLALMSGEAMNCVPSGWQAVRTRTGDVWRRSQEDPDTWHCGEYSAGEAMVLRCAPLEPVAWRMPDLPAEPGMDVVRLGYADRTAGENYWWHVRPGQWYPALRVANRDLLATRSGLACDSWRHVLSIGRVLVDDTELGERPLSEPVI